MTASASDARCVGCERRLDDNRAPVCKYCDSRERPERIKPGQIWRHDVEGKERLIFCVEGDDVWLDSMHHERFSVEGMLTDASWKYVRIDPAGTHLVNSPTHYNTGNIEVIEAIEDWKLGFHEGNVVKYVARAMYKGTELQDLKKAEWYLKRRIAQLEK